METNTRPRNSDSADRKANMPILLDMDGVLVDVTLSYRKAIQETVGVFSGKEATAEEIQEFKQQGGYNNDWDLTEAILKKRGKHVPKKEIIKKFQKLYFGVQGKGGFIENERWLFPKKILEKLHKKHALGIVTGRPREETLYILRKFQLENLFDAIVVMEDYPPEKAKPDPYPIRLAMKKLGVETAIYVGDSVDDVTAAKSAGIKAIGCIPPGISEYPLRDLLLKRGAEQVLKDVADVRLLVE